MIWLALFVGGLYVFAGLLMWRPVYEGLSLRLIDTFPEPLSPYERNLCAVIATGIAVAWPVAVAWAAWRGRRVAPSR